LKLVFPLNIQPTPDGWEYALERPGNEKTIKLIYAIQDITLMVVFDISGTWSNGHNRIFRGFDPDDDKVEVRANGNIPCVIDGNGNCTITGDPVTFIPHFAGTNDNCSLKMRSRHNEPGMT